MRGLDAHTDALIDRMASGSHGPVCLAVSGGSDSLSLLLQASGWAKRTGRDLIVLTVDHGLRSEARAETRFVAERAAALGHDAEILRWTPDRKSQKAARTARHGLLAAAARRHGSQLILLGHTASDVEETLLMRLARPTRLAAAIGPQPVSVSPVWPDGRGLLVGRPLIGLRRETLRAALMAAGESWIDDPSNEAHVYERVRIRQQISDLGPGRLAGIREDAALLRAAEDLALSAHLKDFVSVGAAGLIELQLSGLPQSGVILRRLLGMLLQAGAGSARTVAAPALGEMTERLMCGGPSSRLTLGGAWLQRRGDVLLIGRDPGEANAGWRDGVWDGRYVAGGDERPLAGLPYLVRESAPEGARREIISGRLSLWSEALSRGAVIAASLTGCDAAG